MKLMLLGLLAVVYAKPESFDQPCDPSVTDCPRSETSRQNSCGKYAILKIGIAMFIFVGNIISIVVLM